MHYNNIRSSHGCNRMPFILITLLLPVHSPLSSNWAADDPFAFGFIVAIKTMKVIVIK